MKQKIFVEIGVCDFDTLEPLIDNGWKGYFVEPVKEYADKLKAYDWRVLPTFIKIEHHHIDDIKMKKMLEERGYIVYTEGRDIYAVR